MRFIIRRSVLFLLTLWAALTLNFIIPRLMPGDAALAMWSHIHNANPEQLRALEAMFGTTNQNPLLAYLQYLGNCLTLNFGVTTDQVPVTTKIMQGLPWTIGLVGVSTVIAFALGTLLGMYGAWRRGSWSDNLLSPLLFIVTTFPVFFLGLVILLVFGVALHWFPLDHPYAVPPTLTLQSIGDILYHAVLPGFTLVLTAAGGWIYTMRNNMIATLSEDYVRMARAKGLSSWRIMVNYSARNAILPNLTGFAMQMGFILGGSILIEYIYSYQGLGYLFYQGTTSRDLPLQQALFLLYTLAVLVFVLLADLVTAWLDPRTREA
jgi:peptide/nickel transport system permease protein